MARAGTSSSARRCRPARRALSGLRPDRSGGVASEAVWRVSYVARSWAVPRNRRAPTERSRSPAATQTTSAAATSKAAVPVENHDMLGRYTRNGRGVRRGTGGSRTRRRQQERRDPKGSNASSPGQPEGRTPPRSWSGAEEEDVVPLRHRSDPSMRDPFEACWSAQQAVQSQHGGPGWSPMCAVGCAGEGRWPAGCVRLLMQTAS